MQNKALALIVVVAAGTALAQAPDVQFRAAQQKETVDGDLTAAIKLYQKVADGKATPPPLAARALVRLGRCYERLGSTEAAKVYERVVAQFGKEEAAAEARLRLAGLPGKNGNSAEEGLVARKVLGDPHGTVSNTLTLDGRYTLTTTGFGMDTLDLMTGTHTPVRGGSPLSSAGEVWVGIGNIISPDGRRIAFAISAPGRGELRVASIDGTGIRTLASIKGILKIQPLDWSADGRTVLAVPMDMKPGPEELLLVDANGQKIRPVRITGLAGVRARLSPDGEWIAFEKARNELGRYDRRGDLFIIRTDGSGERQLVRQASPVALAGWDPDGKSVLFASEQVGVDQLWAVPVKEGVAVAAPVSLMKGFSHSAFLGTTMQGALLYSTGSRVLQVLTAKLNGPDGALSAPQPINAPSHYMTINPTWSPNGRFLCYQLMEPDSIDKATLPDSIVMVRDLSNGQEREIGRFPQISRRISWTPDGKSLVFPAATTAGRNVLRVDVGSGKSEALIPTALIDPHSYYAYPQMSPDGQYLYYMQGPVSGVEAHLMRLDLAQQQARQLATVHQFYALSPDGSEFVAPVADRNTTVLRVLGPNGETRRDLITIAERDLLTSFAWSPDGQQVFFSKTTGGNQSSFFRIPASGGSPVSLGVQTDAFRDLSIHPNGSELAFVGVSSDLEIWRLEGLRQALRRAFEALPTRAKQ